MKKKIVGILVCMLLITAAVLPVAGNVKIGSTTEKQVSTSSSRSVGIPHFNGQLLRERWNERIRKSLDRANEDLIIEVKQTTDGGYIATGGTETYSSSEDYDCWLIKTDSSGNEQWNETSGLSEIDVGFSVQQTSDGGYVIVGCIFLATNNPDVLLIKTDSNGNELWNKKFVKPTVALDIGFSVHQTSDGGYVITGFTQSYGAGGSDGWLIKTDSSGNHQWNKTFGGSSHDNFYGSQQIDGGYIITGETESYGGTDDDVWLIKTDGDGNEVLMALCHFFP